MKDYIRILQLFILFYFGILGSAMPQASDDHDQHVSESNGHVEDEGGSRIDSDMASQLGIGSTVVSSQLLRKTITGYGVLSTGPEQLSHMRARFSGLVVSVKASIGDEVRAGQLLAEVESDESLKKYSVLAPITGTVVQRHANTGEVTKDQVLFSIANFDTLWAELRIYPAQRDKVLAGQSVEIISADQKIAGTISHVIPALDKPYQLARVQIDNQSLGLSPGLLVEGRIVIDEFSVPLAVEKNGIQQLDGVHGVFVQEGEVFLFTPLELGRDDGIHVEVLSGLTSNQRYVNSNSYLIKADIEKSEAEHEH